MYFSSPGAEAEDPLGYKFSQYYSVNLVLCRKFSPLNDFVTVFPIQTYRWPNLTLP